MYHHSKSITISAEGFFSLILSVVFLISSRFVISAALKIIPHTWGTKKRLSLAIYSANLWVFFLKKGT